MNIGQSKSTLGSSILPYSNGSALWFLLLSHTKVTNSPVCVCVCVCVHARVRTQARLVAQLCLTLCHPMEQLQLHATNSGKFSSHVYSINNISNFPCYGFLETFIT